MVSSPLLPAYPVRGDHRLRPKERPGPRPSACPARSPLEGRARTWVSSPLLPASPVRGDHRLRPKERPGPRPSAFPTRSPLGGALEHGFPPPPPCISGPGRSPAPAQGAPAPSAFGVPHSLPPWGTISRMGFLLPPSPPRPHLRSAARPWPRPARGRTPAAWSGAARGGSRDATARSAFHRSDGQRPRRSRPCAWTPAAPGVGRTVESATPVVRRLGRAP